MTLSLNVTRCSISSQCRACRSGVTWSKCLVPAMRRTAAFWIDWSRLRSQRRRPVNTALQKSTRANTKQVTSVVRALLDKQRRILRICLNTPKHVEVSRVIWHLIDIVVSRYNPRFLTDSTGTMTSEPTMRWSLGIKWRRRDVLHHNTSDLDVFCCNRLDDISAISATHISIRWRNVVVSTDVGQHEPTICVSSANRCGCRPCCCMSAIRSAAYIMNRIGPRTDPCGTPLWTSVVSEQRQPYRKWCDRNPFSANPLIPYDTRIRRRRISWSTVSNAAERSSSVSATRSPLSSADSISDVTLSNAVSVEWLSCSIRWSYSRGSRSCTLR